MTTPLPARTRRLPRPSGILLVWALLLVSCAPRSQIRSATPLAEIQPPALTLVSGQTRIERFDPPGAGAGLELNIGSRATNPNGFPIKLTGIDYTVFLVDRAVARGVLEPDLFLDSGASGPLRFSVEADLQGKGDLLRAVVRAFADTPLAFSIEGRMRFESSSYAFSTANRVLLRGDTLARESVAPPQLRLDEAQSEVYLLRPDVPVVRVVITALNPGDIGYFLFGKDLVLSLGGVAVATEDMGPLPVPAGDGSRVDILFYPVVAELTGSGRDALEAALAGIPTALEVDGELFMDVLGVDTFAVPGDWRVFGFVDAER